MVKPHHHMGHARGIHANKKNTKVGNDAKITSDGREVIDSPEVVEGV